MRLPLCCTVCAEAGASGAATTVFVPVNDSSIYEVTCKAGHSTIGVVAEQRYEVLFQIGLCAIVDSYHREAVSSFAAALERFYEFAVAVFALHIGVDLSEIEAAWKAISQQSERQLGAFISAYLLAEGRAPSVLPEKVVKLRNAMVHKGKIPTREEALAFGDTVLNVVRPTLRILHGRYRVTFDRHKLNLHLATLQEPRLKGKKVTLHSLPMALRDLDTEGEGVEDRDIYFYLRRAEVLARQQ